MSWYCDIAPGHPVHQPYHDQEYGFPVTDEAKLFERLSLEIFQAGLSWLVVLKKRPGLRAAFAGFDVDQVASFDAQDVSRLLGYAEIIRNRRKIEAVIANARRLQSVRASDGGLAGWLAARHPQPLAAWVKAFRTTFAFCGPEVVNEFLLSIGYLPGAHRQDCPIYALAIASNPPWRIGTHADPV